MVSPPHMSLPSQDQAPVDQARWFAEEVQPHEPALRSWLRNQYPSLGDVDDVVQESYLRLLRRQPAGRIAFTKAYLFAVARHAALRWVHRRRIFSDLPVSELPEWQLLDGRVDVPESVNLQQQDDIVAEAILELPARCREIVQLRAVAGLSYTEIAAKLELSEATVRVQVARGIKKCAQYLRERGVLQFP